MELYGTLGPGCAAADTLEAMFREGMTGMRLNLSHTTLRSAAGQIGANPYRAVPRKVYTVTPAGRALLAGQTKIWRQFAACVQSFIGREKDDE